MAQLRNSHNYEFMRNLALILILLHLFIMNLHGQIEPERNSFYYYDSLTIEFYKVEDAILSVRKVGSGPPLIFVHGFMVNGRTWRFIIPELAKTHTCYIVESAGFGDTQWDKKTKFDFSAHTRRYIALFKILGLKTYGLVAHDTGGSIARMIAISEKMQ